MDDEVGGIVTNVTECHNRFVTLKPKLGAGLRGIVTNVTAFRVCVLRFLAR